MPSRLDLQTKLEELNGNRNIYYQPPEGLKMEYDAIRYSRGVPNSRFANDRRYAKMNCYELIVITKRPDPEVVEKILDLPYSSPGKPYVADNLYHYPITLYY